MPVQLEWPPGEIGLEGDDVEDLVDGVVGANQADVSEEQERFFYVLLRQRKKGTT